MTLLIGDKKKAIRKKITPPSPNSPGPSLKKRGGTLPFSLIPQGLENLEGSWRGYESDLFSFETSKKKSSGLTLIELLLVISIMGLLVFLALPTLSKFGSNIRLKSASEQVSSLFRMARLLATTKNITTSVFIYTREAELPNHIFITGAGGQLEKVWVAPSLIEIPDVSGNIGLQTASFTSFGTTSAISLHLIQKGTLINGNPYDASGTYGSLSKAERVKCQTVTTDNNTGRARVYAYGRNAPWASTDL
ncbi:MAG: prepilin-type N-terminal cleavage/methylation domain-containing protein [Chlamydiae bacterium]|nr:prepilin-type N-terminal cleavage/methylation domain-containing protein [Chlamydiota bacterium]MBI3267034.1 prepilin-type N-terminal cleavage/methylation domain-containing protein [Chlamydiota bacterium]